MPRWSLLSITDLHYASPDSNFVDDPKELGPGTHAYRDDLFVDFHDLLKALPHGEFACVAVCGDITTHGQLDGLRRFETHAISHLLDLAPTHGVCIVPGNHDVKWGLDARKTGAFREKFHAFSEVVKRYKVSSCLIPMGQLESDVNDRLTFERPDYGPIHVDHERKVIVACLNSAIRCGERNPQMFDDLTARTAAVREHARSETGRIAVDALEEAIKKYVIRDVAHVTKAQQQQLRQGLRTIKEQLGDEWDEYLRVGVLHHHLTRFKRQLVEHRGYELLVDSPHVLSLFSELRFDVVLTGHKHQPYVEPYHSGDHQMLLVGGPTVGGAPVGESFQGVRIIDVEQSSLTRTFRIVDVPASIAQEDTLRALDERRQHARPHGVVRVKDSVARKAQVSGYSYREIASITLIDLDGDARRIVECEDLVVRSHAIERAHVHRVSLPPTSGYLANLRAHGRGRFAIRVDPAIPSGSRNPHHEATLTFDQTIGVAAPASYSYEWHAVNAFALDQYQFDVKYGRQMRTGNIEFTHFCVEDPVDELSVIVRFPPGYRLNMPPRLRVTRQVPDNRDASQWTIDDERQDELHRTHALRFYESLNVAALRVSKPIRGISYGIQWEVPPVPIAPVTRHGVVDEFGKRWTGGRLDAAGVARLHDLLARLLTALREGFMTGWTGPVDASVMYFDSGSDTPLVIVAAILEQPAAAGEGYEYQPLAYQVRFRYGDGIGGRAFKTNRLRVYVSRDAPTAPDDLDYYTPIDGIAPHSVLVSLPVHVPEPDGEFTRNPRVYESTRPFAVFSFGSDRADCPLSALRMPEHIPALLQFQHNANKLMFQQLEGIINHR